MSGNQEHEAFRREVRELPESDRRLIAHVIDLNEVLAPLEEGLLDGVIALFGEELGQEAFRLMTNQDATPEEIDAFINKLPL